MHGVHVEVERPVVVVVNVPGSLREKLSGLPLITLNSLNRKSPALVRMHQSTIGNFNSCRDNAHLKL